MGLGSFFLEIGVHTAALQRGLNAAESRISTFGKSAERLGTGLSLAVSAPLALIGKSSIKAAADFETLEVSFGTMLKSMDKGRDLMRDIQKYNLDTSFQSAEVNNAAKSLLAYGFAQQQIIPQLKMIGDLSAGVGIPIKELADIYGKARVQGRLFGEDINQIMGRGINIVAEFANQFKVPEESIKKMTEDGKISFANLEKAFTSMTSTGGQFYNMTANQSKTLAGIYSNFQDSVAQNLKVVGDSIVKNLDLKNVVPQASKLLGDMAKAFSELSPQAQKAIVVVGGLAVVLPPLLALAGTVLPAMATGFAALISPAGLATAAIAGLVALVAEHYLTTKKMSDATRSFTTLNEEVSKSIKTEVAQLTGLKDILDSNTTSYDEKKNALLELKKLNPAYFGNLNAEKINYSELNLGISKYIDNLQKAAEAKKITDKIIKNNEVLADLRKNPNNSLSSFEKSRSYGFGSSSLIGVNKDLNKMQAEKTLSEIETATKKLEDRLKVLQKGGYGKVIAPPKVPDPTAPPKTPPIVPTGAEIKAAQKIAEETLSLRKELQSQTRDLIIASMQDETQRAKSEAQKRAEDEIAAMREKVTGLKNLETEFADWRKNREQALADELVKIQRESFVVPQQIKRQMITDVMNSVIPKEKQKLTADRMQNSLDRTMSLGAAGLQSKSDRNSVGNVLGMSIDIEKWKTDSASYIEAATGIVQANASIKNSLGEIALAAGVSMGETVAQMMMGTATINDLAKSLLSSVGQIFADMLKQMAIAEAKALGIKALLGDPTALFKVIGLAAAGGLVGAFSNKVGQSKASNQQTRQGGSSYNTVLRGSDILASQQRYQTIKAF